MVPDVHTQRTSTLENRGSTENYSDLGYYDNDVTSNTDFQQTINPTSIRTSNNQNIQYQQKEVSKNIKEDVSRKIAVNVLALSQELIKQKLESPSKPYEVLSPVSITSALQLAFLGARGDTYKELANL
jgi:hypothetical protein